MSRLQQTSVMVQLGELLKGEGELLGHAGNGSVGKQLHADDARDPEAPLKTAQIKARSRDQSSLASTVGTNVHSHLSVHCSSHCSETSVDVH